MEELKQSNLRGFSIEQQMFQRIQSSRTEENIDKVLVFGTDLIFTYCSTGRINYTGDKRLL